MKGVYFGFLFFLFSIVAQAQFTSVADGNWNDGATWGNSSPGTSGVDYPAAGQNATIGSFVSIPNGYSASIANLTVGAGVTLTINNGGSLTLTGVLTIDDDGLGGNGFLDVSGTLTANQGSSFAGDAASTIAFNSTGVYNHNFTTSAGSIINATWNSGSTCRVIGYTTNCSAPGSLGQAFSNFTWDTPNFVGTVGVCGTGSTSTFLSLNGNLTTVGGILRVSNTGGSSRTLRLFDATGSNTLTVGGDLIVESSARLVFSTTGTSNIVTVTGNLTINNSTTAQQTFATSGSTTVNVGGNLTMTSTAATTLALASLAGGSSTLNVTGNISLSPSVASTINLASNSTASGSINVSGNYSANSSVTLSTTATAGSTITFAGTSVQTYQSSASISSKINFKINTGSTLDLGTSSLIGTGTFTILGGGTLKVGSSDGLVKGSSLGNIRVTGTRTYTANSNIIYNGASAQNLGDEWSSTGSLSGVQVNLEIANANGVTNNIVGSTNLVGTLRLTSGALNIGNSNSLTIQNNLIVTSGTIGGDATSDLILGGSGSLGTLAFASGKQSLNNLTVSRSTELVLGSDLAIYGTINLSGGNLNFSGRTLTMSGSSITTNATGLKSSNTSNLVFDGSSFSGTIPFSGSGNQLNNLTFGTNGGVYTWNSSVTINGQVNLNLGSFTHSSGLTMANNSTFVKGGGTYSGVALAVSGGGKFNLTYTGAGNTGAELPTLSTTLNNLKISSSGTITLNSSITSLTVNGNFETENGTFDSNSKDITVVGNFLSGSAATLTGGGTFTFSGTTSSITGDTDPIFGNLTITSGTVTFSRDCSIRGALVNNGTISSSSGVTTTFSGTTAITGSGTTSFRNLSVTGALTAPSTMNVAGTFTNSGTFTHNGGTVVFNGTTSFSGTTPSFNHVSITGTVTAPSTWNIAGNLSNSGTFSNNNGSLVLNGTVSPQAITGTFDVNDISISNPSGVNNNGTINLSGVLTLTSASAVFDADGSGSGNLFIKSTAINAGGRIAAIPTGATLSGNVTVERFINGNQPDYWRLLSMPITNGSVASWKTNFPVTGSFSDPSPNGSNNVIDNTKASIYFWNTTSQAYAAVGSGGSVASTTLANANGYYVYTFLTSDFTSSVKGPVRTGNITIPISTTVNSYALVPNPYPSPIDWDNITLTNINSSMSLKTTAKVVAYYTKGGPAVNPPYPTWTGEVAVGQSFWIQSNGASGLNLTESSKTLSNFQFIRDKEPQNYIKINVASSSQRDEAAIWFVDGATTKFDAEFDASKMSNSILNVPGAPAESYLGISTGVLGESGDFAINSLAPINCNTTFTVNLSDVSLGRHTISFSDLDKMELGYTIVLVDKFANEERIVSEDLSYDFEVTADSTSLGRSRFQLRFLVAGSPYLNSLVGPKVSIANACDPDKLPLSFNAQAGVDYQFFVNDKPVSGVISTKQSGEVTVDIDKSKLNAGQNSLTMSASLRSGCDQFSYAKSVEFNNQAILPVSIETSGSLLLTDGDSNQWFKDGVAIEGATTSSFLVTEPGDYFVQRSYGGCVVNSQILSFSLESLSSQYLQAFPNPAKNRVNFIVPAEVQQNLKSISMFDVKGVRIMDSANHTELMNAGMRSIDVSNQKPGIYIIKIISDKIHHLKFIKE